jgi:hypothetical protein
MFALKKAEHETGLSCDMCFSHDNREIVVYGDNEQYICCECIDKMRECWNNGATHE